MIHAPASSYVVATSRTVLAVASVACILCPLVLATEVASQGWSLINIAFAGLSILLVPYAAWISTFEVRVEKTRMVVNRFFNLVSPIVILNADIEEFRAKSKASGRLIHFEVLAGGRKVVQLHSYQDNFLAAVAAARSFNPTVAERA